MAKGLLEVRSIVAGLLAVSAVGGTIFLVRFNSVAFAQSGHEHRTTQQQADRIPTLAGQDAFATMQEIVEILEADSTTDWSQVNLEALREHLIDMNEVTLNAVIEERAIDQGIEVSIAGTGRTKNSIQRLIPAHAQELNQMDGLQATTATLPDGIRLTVTSEDSQQVRRIQALGFIGLLVSGNHHQEHHLALARGVEVH